MGTCLPPTTMNHQHQHRFCGGSPNSTAASPSHFISVACSSGKIINFSAKFNRVRFSLFNSCGSFPLFPSNPRACSCRCQASSPGPGPPPPPKLEPPSGGSRAPPSGALSTFSQVQDAVRIFFAVLFWMSLFFWSCVWDGRNNGRPDKGPRFRR